MAKQAAPVSLTGGEGFNYEDRVAARFLIDMLSGAAPFGVDFGSVTKVDWQVRDTGRLLDDLSIKMRSSTGEHIAELSIKSHRQVTSSGFPSNFVESAWEEWLHTETTTFQNDRDLLVLVTGEIANDVQESWFSLLRQARATDSNRLINRLKAPAPGAGSQTSDAVRELFKSLQCPDSLRSRGQSEQTDAVEILRRIRILHFNFESDPSRDQVRAVEDCQRLLKNSALSESQRLWNSLVALAAEYRGKGGTLDSPTLLSKLRSSFQFEDHPDYSNDWKSLERATHDVLSDIRTKIGANSKIERDQEANNVVNALETSGVCLVAGESGCGKSALAKNIATEFYDTSIAILPEDCEVDRLQQLDERFGITHSLLEVLCSNRNNCLLIVETMERFSERGLRIIGRLISQVLADIRFSHVHVLLLVQYEATHRVISRLCEAGIEQPLLDPQLIAPPPEDAIKHILQNSSGILWATLHLELRPLLGNLKILDWVVRAAQSGRKLDGVNVTGLITLIEYLWDRWIESDDRGLAGGGLLKKIAALEAESLAAGVPLTDLDYSEQQALSSLTSADLLKRRNERIIFSHDLLGDWARLKVLIGNDPTSSTSDIQRFAMARWHRAIRLFGRWLLSQDDGINRWSEAIQRVESSNADQGVIVRDLLLESVIVSENSRVLLSMAWPALIQHDGRLLKLLLDRFMFVATIPDLRIPGLVKNENVSPQVEAAFRVPKWPYWGSVLITLEEHRDEICRLVPDEAARISKLWLEKTPYNIDNETKFPFRENAASIAISIAREFQARQAENESLYDSEVQIAYESALLAAREIPDEVSSFALEMAKRKPSSPDIQKRAEAAKVAAEESRRQWEEENPDRVEQLRELGESPFPLGDLVEPWPEGPSEDVESAFRDAVFDNEAILPLAESRPEIAVEVLLAACIEPPHYEDSFGSFLMDNCGLESWRERQPAMYFQGPFLQLLRLCPSQGIEFTLKLINFATSRWATHEEKNRKRNGAASTELADFIEVDDSLEVIIQIGDEKRKWIGDRRVFRWYLDWPIDCRIIPCVLMALEKWIYEQIDAEEDVDHWLQKIVEKSESVAFAGLLIDVGKRKPDLFLSSLRPLLSVSTFYLWEPRILMERSSASIGLMGWHRQPHDLIELAREWYSAPHRKYELRRIAVGLMFKFSDMEDYFRECRKQWNQEIDSMESSDNLRFLIEMLNRDNYQETPAEDDLICMEFVPPEDLVENTQEDLKQADDWMTLLSFPIDCRKILDGEKDMSTKDCTSFWETAKQIAELEEIDEDRSAKKAAAISGAVAVLLNQHSEWVEAVPERLDWCLNQLHRIIENPPQQHRFDMPKSASSWVWDSFVAEAAICLLKVAPESLFVRDLVANGIAAYHYETTKKTMELGCRYRQTLGKDFELMQQLAIRWSVVRRLQSQCSRYLSEAAHWKSAGNTDTKISEMCDQIKAVAEQWREEDIRIIERFVKAESLSTTFQAASQEGQEEVEALADIRYPARKKHKRSEQSTRRYHHQHIRRKDLGVDSKVITAAFSWLKETLPSSNSERRECLSHAKDLLHLILTSIQFTNEEADDMDGLPTEFDGWVFDLAARVIVQMQDEDDPSSLWKPILTLGEYADKWIERFFWYWFSDGFNMSPDIKTFQKRWSEMITFALSSPRWDPQQVQGYDLDEIVFELMGYHLSLNSFATEPQFATTLQEMIPIYEKVVQKWFSMPKVVNGFARSLSEPGYSRILCQGIIWLHRSIPNSDDYHFWRESDIETNLIATLHHCWEKHAESVCLDSDLQEAFLGILTALSTRGNHAVMALKERVLDSFTN